MISNWADYFYDPSASQGEFDKREEVYQAFVSRMISEGYIAPQGGEEDDQ